MSKQVKEIFIFILIVLVLGGCYITYTNIRSNGFSSAIFENKIFIGTLILSLILILVVFVRNFIFGKQKSKELKYRDKLFNSLVFNSDTIYVMYNYNERKYIYTTKNIDSVLGVKLSDNGENEYEYIDEVFKNPVLLNELDNWNKKDDFVSQMISYRNPGYQHTRWLKIKIYPFKDKKITYHVILISDVTKEHDQQHLLVMQASDIKTREKQLNQITSISYDLEIDINVTTKEFNLRNLKPDTSYLGSNIKGNYVLDFESIIEKYINKEDLIFFKKEFDIDVLTKKANDKNYEPITVRYRLNNDDTIWLESTAFFTTNQGEVHVTILTKNVTENAEYMRNQNIRLQNALDESKKANKAKDEFLSIMSHEIRTPMTTILGLSSSILNEKIPNNVKEDIENINEASTNLLDIIDGILDISKIEKGGLVLDEKEYESAKFFKDIEKYANQNLNNDKVKVILNIDKNIPSKLFGDSTKIRQILASLIDNAIKFTKKGKITISAKSEKKGGLSNLNISISDTGSGIKQDKLEMLFSENKKTDDKKYVEGMGLSITKKLIDLLKGEIDVQSEVGKGTNFVITITQKIIDNKPIGSIDEYVSKKKKVNSFSAKGKRILVVDDNKLNIKVALRLLEPYNADVDSVTSGYEAIDLLKKDMKYDLILLDQMMPGLDGITTLHEIKKIEGFNIPVVALTADAIVGKKEEYLKEGFDDYLSKPINNDELYNILKKYLKNRGA